MKCCTYVDDKTPTKCGRPRDYITIGGQSLCTDHANLMVTNTLLEKNIFGVYLAVNGTMPKTVSEARARWLVPVN